MTRDGAGARVRHCGVPEIAPSEELRAFLLRLYALMEEQDVEGFREMFSSAPQLLVAGSDPEEWWSGREGVEVFVRQLFELPMQIVPGEIQAFSAGPVGWVADQCHVRLPDGTEQPKRVTAVVMLERGHWRIVQWHAASPVRNDDALPYSLTTSVQDLATAVLQDRPDVPAVSAPDGTVTVMFSDIESSTVLLERLGDPSFMRLLAWHDRIVRDTAAEHRGYIVKSQGDGFMIAFPSAAYALRSCLSMHQRLSDGFGGIPVRIRTGLHAGEAFRHDDDFYGRTVVIAARISALAIGGEVLASSIVHALTSSLGTFSFGEPRTVALKGLDGHFEVYPVVG